MVTRPSWPKTLVSVGEYLRLEEESPVRHEYIAGMLYEMPGTTKQHNRLIRNLVRVVGDEAETQNCQSYFEAVKVQPFPDIFYYPDFIVVCGDDGKDEHIVENPCLIVEVLSKSSEDTDRREKWSAYRQFDSLLAYLLVHQTNRHIEGFLKQSNGDWQFIEVIDKGAIELLLPSMKLEIEELYKGIL